MKLFMLLALGLGLLACGEESENYRGRSSIELTKQAAPLVASEDQLPACTPNIGDTLIFVEDKNAFKICKRDVWVDVQGADAIPAGASLVELRRIIGKTNDICYDDEQLTCLFEGGEFLRYQDGRVQYTVRVKKKIRAQNMDGTISENSDMMSIRQLHEANWPDSRIQLMTDVVRDGIVGGVWLRFVASTREFTLVFDSNNDGALTDGDIILQQLQLVEY